MVKPGNQLQLTEKELDEELTRILNANNPLAPQNIARYNLKERVYKCVPNANHLLNHFEVEGYLIYRDGEEEGLRALKSFASHGHLASSQNNLASSSAADASSVAADHDRDTETLVGDQNDDAGNFASAAVGEKAGNAETGAGHAAKNQFTLCERAAQTLNNPSWDRFTNTEPPPRRTFTDTVNQWTIYDAYVEDIQQKEKSTKDRSKNAGNAKGHKDDDRYSLPAPLVPDSHGEEVYYKSQELRKAIQIIERMANQNTFDDVTQDYKYWEDKADEIRESKSGILLPLWKFVHDKEKRKTVTALSWSPALFDFFAVGFGSYDFSKQGPGCIACFTLKNPSHPEIAIPTQSGVMSVDFHKRHAHLLAVGMYDGNVAIYNLQKKTNTPAFASDIRNKHADPVWQVAWQNDDLDENLNFFSISSDGQVAQWTVLKNELIRSDVIQLSLGSGATPDVSIDGATNPAARLSLHAASADQSPVLSPLSPLSPTSVTSPLSSATPTMGTPAVELSLSGSGADAIPTTGSPIGATISLEGGSCFDFHPTVDHLFVVGTEEGRIHQCSKTYNKQFLLDYEGHNMAVYALKYSHLYPGVFLSASADWTVKLWDQNQSKPVMTFDLASSVGDVAWAPYSSTVFAAVTADSKVYVFDLEVNKYSPICVQQIVRKGKLTHVRFNQFEPVLLVGDDRGTVTTLKLSPNLRKTASVSRGEDEQSKFERILLLVSGKSI